LIFVDSMLEGDPYQLHGEAYSTINLDDWKPLPAQDKPAADEHTLIGDHPGSNEHYVMVAVSPMRNYGNAAKTYLGTTDDIAQRKMIAAIVAHEMGHAIRIDGHTTTSLETVFELQSKIANDGLYLHPNEITHPCRIKTDFPLNWRFWEAPYDTIGEIFTALPPEKYGSKRWVKPAATTWSALELKETVEYIKPDGGSLWTQIRAYDSQWTMCSPVGPRVAKDLLGFIQTADSGTPYISVKYHFGAPKYKYGAP
jgi:hypothetical protein